MEKEEKILYAGLLFTLLFLLVSISAENQLMEKFSASLAIISGVITIKQLMYSKNIEGQHEK
jgi:hypothetical protein